MRQKSGVTKDRAEKVVRDIRRATHSHLRFMTSALGRAFFWEITKRRWKTRGARSGIRRLRFGLTRY